jgi:preprotein translocase SecE subunit
MDSQSKNAPPSRALPLVSARGLKGYILEVQAEAKKVTWPAPQETTRLTGVVVVVCGIVVVLLLGLGFVADKMLDILVRGSV